ERQANPTDAPVSSGSVKAHGALSQRPRERTRRYEATSGLAGLRVRLPSLSGVGGRQGQNLQDRSLADAWRDDGVSSVRPLLHDEAPPADKGGSQAPPPTPRRTCYARAGRPPSDA